MVLVLGFAACAQAPYRRSRVASSIDATYRFRQQSRRSGIKDQPSSGEQSPFVSFYRQALSKALYSQCLFYPSDSTYAQALMGQCGRMTVILKTASRLLLESEVSHLGLSVAKFDDHIKFLDYDLNCEIL